MSQKRRNIANPPRPNHLAPIHAEVKRRASCHPLADMLLRYHCADYLLDFGRDPECFTRTALIHLSPRDYVTFASNLLELSDAFKKTAAAYLAQHPIQDVESEYNHHSILYLKRMYLGGVQNQVTLDDPDATQDNQVDRYLDTLQKQRKDGGSVPPPSPQLK